MLFSGDYSTDTLLLIHIQVIFFYTVVSHCLIFHMKVALYLPAFHPNQLVRKWDLRYSGSHSVVITRSAIQQDPRDILTNS